MAPLCSGLGVLAYGIFNSLRGRPAAYQPWRGVLFAAVGGFLGSRLGRLYADTAAELNEQYGGTARLPSWMHGQLTTEQLRALLPVAHGTGKGGGVAAQIQPCERVCCGWRRPAGRGAAEAAAGGSGRSVGTRRGFTAHAPTASRLTYPAPAPPPPLPLSRRATARKRGRAAARCRRRLARTSSSVVW